MQAHPTMEILPFGDAYLVAGCSVLKGLSPRGAVPQGLAPSRPPSRGRHPRCPGQAGWQATGASGKPFGDFPSPFPAPQGAGPLFAAGLGSTAMQGGGTSTGTAGSHPRQGTEDMDHPAPGAHSGPGSPASSPRSSAHPWASGTAAKCSLSASRMRAE